MPGPKPSVDKNEIERLLNERHLKKDIAKMLGVSYATIKKHSRGLKSKKTNTRYICRTCGIKGEEHFYYNAAYQCKDCWNKRTAQKQKDKVKQLKEEYGGKCSRCGYDKCIDALEFHHTDPTVKEFHLGEARGLKIETLRAELDKCELVCRNCHTEIHYEMKQPIG